MNRTKLEVDTFFHLRNDYIFKRVFKTEDTEILQFLINSIVRYPVNHLAITSGESLSYKIKDKRIYQDIRSKDENGNIYNIEMQNSRITSVQEDRFLFTGCKNIAGQLYAGDNYRKIKRSEVIVFTSSRYDNQLLVSYEMHDPLAERSLKNRKLIIHIISLPVIEEIISVKEKTKEALTDLEIICLAIWKGITDMTYKKANKQQRKVLKVMENRLNTLYNDPMEMTRAEDEFFYQLDLIEREKIGISIGEEKGIPIGERQLMVKILAAKFDGLSLDAKKAVMEASAEVIDQLSKKIFDLKDERELMAVIHPQQNYE